MTKRAEKMLNNVFREMYIQNFKTEIAINESLAIVHSENGNNILATICWNIARSTSDLMYEIFDDRYTSVNQNIYNTFERLSREISNYKISAIRGPSDDGGRGPESGVGEYYSTQ